MEAYKSLHRRTSMISAKDGNVVLISEEEYNNMKENLFIMSNPAMVKRLNESINQIINHQFIEMSLEDLKKYEDR